MRTAEFDYELPPGRVAVRPPLQRDGGRLLVVDAGELLDRHVRDLASFVEPGALVVVNDTRVIRARLLGKREGSGGRAEVFLLAPREVIHEAGGPSAALREAPEPSMADRPAADSPSGTEPRVRWRAMARASKPLRVGQRIEIDGGHLVATIVARVEGERALEVELTRTGSLSVEEAIEASGHVPLPPYVARDDDEEDASRYQTLFARAPGAVAAPTAGLHLSEAVLAAFAARGVQVASCTLHVGLGTFEPVTAEDLDDHPMHAETFTVDADLVAAIDAARTRGAPVVAIGTTVVRALESAADPHRQGHVREVRGAETRLCIQPGYGFRVVDALVTNFHLPRSTLLALVSAFAGLERVRAAYAHAIASDYRFYSYGDAMFIPRRLRPGGPPERPSNAAGVT